MVVQKYRLYLKRLSGVTNQQSGMGAHFAGQDPFSLMSPDMGVNIANGQLTPQTLARFHMLGRMNSPNGMGFSGGLDPVLNTIFLQDLPPQPPHLNGMLKNNAGLLSSLPNGLQHLEQLSAEPHHLPGVNDLDDYPSNTKVFPQLNGSLDVSIASLGVGNGSLGPNPSNDNLLMHMYPRGAPQQGGGSSSNLPQPRGGLTSSHLLSNDINFAPVGPLPSLAGNLTPAVGLSAITGSGGGRDLSPTVGGTGTSLSSPLGTLVRRPLMAEDPSNLVNSTSGAFSMAPSVQSPKPGGAAASVNEGLDQQQQQTSMWTLYNQASLTSQLSHVGHSQGLHSHDSVPWSGLAENLGLGDIGQSLSAGLSSQFSPHSQDHGIGFAPPSRGSSYTRSNHVSFPVSSALDGRMVRSSYEP